MTPEQVWRWSQALHRHGFRRSARILKFVNYMLFRAILPPQAQTGRGLRLGHLGLGVVVHPNVTIGADVTIWHHVTISATTWVGSDVRITIEDGVTIGAGSIIVGRHNESLVLGRRCSVGAGSVVTQSIESGAVVVGNPARPIR
ncbi:serine acetyltransferase [Microbacterium sp. Gd 4-13]|nr:serine acetyltransferase [Microbacterium sp. Gd 4-13]